MILCKLIDDDFNVYYDLYCDGLDLRIITVKYGFEEGICNKMTLSEYLDFVSELYNETELIVGEGWSKQSYMTIRTLIPLFEITFPVDIAYYKEKYPEEFI